MFLDVIIISILGCSVMALFRFFLIFCFQHERLWMYVYMTDKRPENLLKKTMALNLNVSTIMMH